MRILAMISLIGIAASSVAQITDDAELDEIVEMVRRVGQLERETVIADELEMTPDERARFWPIYDEYRAELKSVDDRLVALILEFAENYRSMPEATAVTMVDDYLDIEMDRLKVRQKYIRRLDDVLPPRKLARFVQIENKLDSVARLAIAEEVPLVR